MPDTSDSALPEIAPDAEGVTQRGAFRVIERAFLIVVAGMTVAAAGFEVWRVIQA